MTSPKSRILAAVVGALGLTAVGATAAWAEDAPQASSQEIAELKAKVAALEAKQASNSKDVASAIDAVLRDADKRSRLMADMGAGAGYDEASQHFYIRTGAFTLRPGVQFDFRNVTDYRENTAGHKEDEIDNGFEVRRLKFELGGNVLSEDLTYFFQWATNRSGGALVLEDAWLRYEFSAPDWGVRVGQFKDPVAHEELTSSKRQLAVDRSLANEMLSGGITDRIQGVSLIYGNNGSGNNPLYAEVVIHDGLNSDNTNFTKAATGTDFGVSARVEYKAMGDWKSYSDFTARGNTKDLLVVGLGGDWTQAGDNDILHGALDVQWEMGDKLGVFAALYVQHFEGDSLGSTFSDDVGDINNWGFVVQAGYMLNPAWEIFGRWDYVKLDDPTLSLSGTSTSSTDQDEFHEITVGVNYYMGPNGSWGHRSKITVDLNYLPNGSHGGDTGLGYTGDNGDHDEWALRAQWQLLL
jgi:hypothetical protein